MTPAVRRWFHYTFGPQLAMIMRDSLIRRTKAGVGKGERAAVWFSCRETWEPTASKGAEFDPETGDLGPPPSIAEMVDLFGPMVRLEVSEDSAGHTWAEHLRIGGIDLRTADALAASAIDQGANPADWRVSYHDVRDCISIEASEDGVTWELVVDAKGAVDPAFTEKVKRALDRWKPPA